MNNAEQIQMAKLNPEFISGDNVGVNVELIFDVSKGVENIKSQFGYGIGNMANIDYNKEARFIMPIFLVDAQKESNEFIKDLMIDKAENGYQFIHEMIKDDIVSQIKNDNVDIGQIRQFVLNFCADREKNLINTGDSMSM